MAVATKAWDVIGRPDSEAAIGDVAHPRGMTRIAAKAALTRVGFYEAQSEAGNPSFATIAAVMKALGMRLSVAP